MKKITIIALLIISSCTKENISPEINSINYTILEVDKQQCWKVLDKKDSLGFNIYTLQNLKSKNKVKFNTSTLDWNRYRLYTDTLCFN